MILDMADMAATEEADGEYNPRSECKEKPAFYDAAWVIYYPVFRLDRIVCLE